MLVSIFDIFRIGLGPSSSHTVGPMLAAKAFLTALKKSGKRDQTYRIVTDLYGSLALTGEGHGTPKAVILGLAGHAPDTVDPDEVPTILNEIAKTKTMSVPGGAPIPFREKTDIVMRGDELLPLHTNGMRFSAFDKKGDLLKENIYYSTGGGAICTDRLCKTIKDEKFPFEFDTMADLLALCKKHKMTIADIMQENENALRSEQAVFKRIDRIRTEMRRCINRGRSEKGILPGGLNVPRRAPDLYNQLTQNMERTVNDPLTSIDWLNLWALAVAEENAAGSRVVTAPTNGAAGIMPAVLRFMENSIPENTHEEAVRTFFLTAGAIGNLYRKNASISGAEVGCQGEIGVACSMAAGGLAAALGATMEQVENAAEIGMEHNLGLTCDPVAGLVQIPCIERNAMGAVKAINAVRLAFCGDGSHFVSLDKVIETMRQTGEDMQDKYKETAKGGLAVNISAC